MGTYGISGVFWILQIVAGVICIMDVQKHSDAAFEAAGTPKQTALIISILGLVCCWIALAYYWFAVKPKVEAAEAGGGYPPAA